jgi:hypothetical protein
VGRDKTLQTWEKGMPASLDVHQKPSISRRGMASLLGRNTEFIEKVSG